MCFLYYYVTHVILNIVELTELSLEKSTLEFSDLWYKWGKNREVKFLEHLIPSLPFSYSILVVLFTFWSPNYFTFYTTTYSDFNTPPQDGANASYNPILQQRLENNLSGKPLVRMSASWFEELTYGITMIP